MFLLSKGILRKRMLCDTSLQPMLFCILYSHHAPSPCLERRQLTSLPHLRFSWSVAVYRGPCCICGVGQLVRAHSHYGPVLLMQVEDTVMHETSDVVYGIWRTTGGPESWSWVIPQWVEEEVVGQGGNEGCESLREDAELASFAT